MNNHNQTICFQISKCTTCVRNNTPFVLYFKRPSTESFYLKHVCYCLYSNEARNYSSYVYIRHVKIFENHLQSQTAWVYKFHLCSNSRKWKFAFSFSTLQNLIIVGERAFLLSTSPINNCKFINRNSTIEVKVASVKGVLFIFDSDLIVAITYISNVSHSIKLD